MLRKAKTPPPLSLDAFVAHRQWIESISGREIDDTAKRQLGEAALALLALLNNRETTIIISGHYDYIHQMDNDDNLPADGPNIISSPMDHRERRVSQQEFKRAYLLNPDNAQSSIAFVDDNNLHYVFTQEHISDLNLHKDTLLSTFDRIDDMHERSVKALEQRQRRYSA